MNLSRYCLHILLLSFTLLATSAGNSQQPAANPMIYKDAVAIAQAYGEQRSYSILRKGRKIGSHTLQFKVTGEQLTVLIDSSIRVRILGIPVYRLSYSASEVWINNTLVSAYAQTTENGKSQIVEFELSEVDTGAEYASNHWHPGVLVSSRLFNTLTGDTENITVEALGKEMININSQQTDSLRYRYQYEQPVDSWYDASGLWAKLQFTAEDGSLITYIREE